MKAKPHEVVVQAEKSGRPVVLTRYGKGVAVLLSVDAFEELEAAASKLRLISALREAERAVARGEVVSHQSVDELLASWEADGP
jgi:prevent-host-death family protein